MVNLTKNSTGGPSARIPRSIPLIAFCLLGCAGNPSARLERMYDQSLEADGSLASPRDLARVEERRRDWIEEVRSLHAKGRILSDLDLLHAASLLMDSDDLDDLILARDLALEAAERGEDRGFPLAAEAVDRSLMKQGLPQKYCTQYAYLPEHGWVLYRWDEAVSDVERRAMGVPTLGEALELLKRLNTP